MSATTTQSIMPKNKAHEAVKHVIEVVLGFAPFDTCPLWLSLKDDMPDESHINIYSTWLWLTAEDISALEYLPDPKTPKVATPLPCGYRVHITRFTAMYHELRQDPSWDDIGIFNLTYDQYMFFPAGTLPERCPQDHLLVHLVPALPIPKTPSLSSRNPSNENLGISLLSRHSAVGPQ
jgi:hypothetical protein